MSKPPVFGSGYLDPDAVEQLSPGEVRDVARNMATFHSRQPRESCDVLFESDAPSSLIGFGEPIWVRYYCDKDDPETRAARQTRGRSADPDGVQGVWKRFIHQHNQGLGLTLFTSPQQVRRRALGSVVNLALDVEWPDSVGWLGVFQGVHYRGADGREATFAPRGWHLWMFPDTSTLMACPDPRKPNAARDAILWHGGALRVTYRGIQG